MKRKQEGIIDVVRINNSEKRRKHSEGFTNTFEQEFLSETKVFFNDDILGIIFDYLEFYLLARKYRFVCRQWNQAFCNMPLISSIICAPFSNLFQIKASCGELYMIRKLSLEGITGDFDFSWLPKLEELYLVPQGTNIYVPDSIRYLTSLRVLELNKFEISESDISAWAELPKLEELTVKHCREFYDYDAYQEFSNLKKLDLHFNNYRFSDYSGIFPDDKLSKLTHFTFSNPKGGAICFTETLPNLTFLKLSDCDINLVDPSCLPLLSELVLDSVYPNEGSEPLFNMPSVKKITMGGSSILETFTLSSFSQVHELEVRDLEGENIFSSEYKVTFNFDGLRKFSIPHSVIRKENDLTLFKNLTELNVNDCKLEKKTLKSISKLTELRSLNIGKCGIEIDIYKILKDLVNLTYLDLEDCGVTDISPLTKFINLTYLNLKNNYLEGDCLQQLGHSLQCLKELNLEKNQVTHLEPLSYLTFLESLMLENLKSSDIHEDQLHHLLKLEYLTKLSLCNIAIGEETAKLLGRGLFRHLKLIACELSDKSLEYIIMNLSLRNLEIMHNNISNEGVNFLEKSNVPFLQRVNISGNNYTHLCARNYKVKVFDFSGRVGGAVITYYPSEEQSEN